MVKTDKRKYEQIRENLMFMTRAKDDTLHALIALGKKMGPFRYLMIAVLFVFLFVYHASFHLFVQMKMRERFARAMAAAMAVSRPPLSRHWGGMNWVCSDTRRRSRGKDSTSA